jgi:hypothetical protein
MANRFEQLGGARRSTRPGALAIDQGSAGDGVPVFAKNVARGRRRP